MKQFPRNPLFVCVLEICTFILFSVTAHAATSTVTTTADDGAGSLRAAVATANSTVDDDIINFSIPSSDPNCTSDGVCTITLISGELVVNSTSTAGKLMIVNSTGASNLKVSGNNASRIFFVDSGGDLTLNEITIMNGVSIDDGGGIYNLGALTLTSSIVTNNSAKSGGSGIYNGDTSATLIITNSTISDNTTNGFAAIFNFGTIILTNSIVSNNTSVHNGGGINNNNAGATLTVINSTIAGNKATGSGGGIGGGIVNADGTVTLTNSTISNNTATTTAGGIFNTGKVTLSNSTLSNNTSKGNTGGIFSWSIGEAVPILNITNSTITGNSALSIEFTAQAGGIANLDGIANLNNTIVAGNTIANSGTSDFLGTITSSSAYNLIGSNRGVSGITNGTNGNQVGTPTNPIDPRLAPLAYNGGATQTHALMPDSPAIDKGNTSDLNTDQRGLARPVDLFNYPNAANGDGADIGAFELQTAPTAASVTISGRAITSNGRGLFNALVAMTNGNGETRYARTSISGRYHFNDVTAGSSVVITVLSKRYSFAPQVLMVTGEALNVDFLAQDGLSKQ